MKFAEIVEKLELAAKDITRHTYFYINTSDELVTIEKRTDGTPCDEQDSLGYAFTRMYDLATLPGEFTLQELARDFDEWPYSTLAEYARKGKLKAHKIGRQWFATRQAVLDLR